MTIQIVPEDYRWRSETVRVGERFTLPYHSTGISILPADDTGEVVTVTYLKKSGENDDEGNCFTVKRDSLNSHEAVIGLPHYSTGETVCPELDGEKATVYWLG
ncbi:hypothetical protein [Halobaculum gomorrense]|uniref:Uncharacterized protein n=1 Tax=Halobaculum gomorrense TaxID=43928 RepID=A0A1M5LUV0_9EURY|nr:hypothetical protein [Halobaculum gomorrense]SHG68884.1 hypothetical protein SAMN05443636_0786 [Halobaculum gomorrense]